MYQSIADAQRRASRVGHADAFCDTIFISLCAEIASKARRNGSLKEFWLNAEKGLKWLMIWISDTFFVFSRDIFDRRIINEKSR
jgi:hypothetical protein